MLPTLKTDRQMVSNYHPIFMWTIIDVSIYNIIDTIRYAAIIRILCIPYSIRL